MIQWTVADEVEIMNAQPRTQRYGRVWEPDMVVVDRWTMIVLCGGWRRFISGIYVCRYVHHWYIPYVGIRRPFFGNFAGSRRVQPPR